MNMEVNEKKKRGRKPKKNQDITVVKVPKKRGRKPKNQIKNDLVSNPNSRNNNNKNQRNFGVDQLENTKPPKKENVILHLSVHSNDNIGVDSVNNTPSEVETIGLKDHYANLSLNDSLDSSIYNLNDSFVSTPSLNDKNIDWKREDCPVSNPEVWNNAVNNNIDFNKLYQDERFKNIQLNNYIPYNSKVDNLMKQFLDCNKRNIWPNHTPIYCFWCCHPFMNQPCCLPISFDEGKFKVFGNFCSPECAASYNFYEYPDTDNKWERYNLLNLLYRKIGKNKDLKIKLAQPRTSLNIFGGPLCINQFREMNSNYEKTYNINYPPLVSVIPQIEETNFEAEKLVNKDSTIFIPLDEERLADASENLKLKRSRPISDSKNTLETCMNLQFNK